MLGLGKLDKSLPVLDVGCGIGTGMLHLKSLGFQDVFGIDTDECRIQLAERRGLSVLCKDLEELGNYYFFDVVWSSHSFEHFKNPDKALDILMQNTTKDALFYFILPYPDLNPSALHVASREIGLNVSDGGLTLVKWFTDRGLKTLDIIYDDFRESEIWLKFRKKK